jgi:hypothetical protein
MLKKLLSIILLFTVFFLSCKKDTQINPPIAKSVDVIPLTPFVIKDSIYPTPCNGTFTIKTNTTDSQSVQLYNRWGQLLINLTINGTTSIVDNSLINGTYFILITNSAGKKHYLLTVLK